MWHIEYNDSNYTAFLQTMAGALNTRVKRKNSLHIPKHYGDGYMHAITLNDGISVLLSDTTLTREMYMHRNASQNFQYLILQLNETIVPHNGYDDKDENENEDVLKLKQNIVILTNSFMSLKFLLPANMRMRSIKIIFEKKHLAAFFPNEVVENFFTKYFSLYFRQPCTEPMDAEYRMLMNEIVKEEIQHPLKNNFIYNRLMLVLEKFFTGFYKRLQNAEKPLKNKKTMI